MVARDREDLIDELFDAASTMDAAARAEFFASRRRSLDDSVLTDSMVEEVRALLDANDEALENDFLQQPYFKDDEEHRFNDAQIGQTLDGYTIRSLIAEGGMGEVYLAHDEELNFDVAIKIVRGGFGRKDLIRRFHAERRILAQLKHPNIAKIFKGGTTKNGLPYLVMEYIDGHSITAFADENKLSTRARLELFRKVCAAVAYAHQHLVIHLDIKPSNVLVTAEGEPKLLDFGIAKLLDPTRATDQTLTYARAMTPEYASPEQIKGEALTTATDVYSLGLLLYELLTGHRPYRLKNRRPDEVAQIICRQEPERPSVAVSRVEESSLEEGKPPVQLTHESTSERRDGTPERLRHTLRGDLDNIVLMALRKEPERRYVSIGQFSEDIRKHLAGLPVIAHKDTFSYRANKFIRRHKIGVAAATLVLLSLIGGIVATTWQAHVARQERARSERRFNDVRRIANSFMFEIHDSLVDLPGSLATRQLLVKRALEYLDSLVQEADTDRALQSELAVAYNKIGVLSFNVEKSLESHLKATAINEALVKAEPNNKIYREQLADSYNHVAGIMKDKGDTASALDYYRKAVGISEALVAGEPSKLSYLAQLRDLDDEFGLVLATSGDVAGALDKHRQAFTLAEQLATFNPSDTNDRRERVSAYLFIGKDLMDQGEYAAALETDKRALALCEALIATDPANRQYQIVLWATHRRLGETLAKMETTPDALRHYRQALGIIESLIAADPTDTGFGHYLSISHLAVGQTLAQLGETGKALDNYRRAIEISERLLANDPSRAETRFDLARIYAETGSLLTTTNKLDEASRYLQRATSLQETLVQTDTQNARAQSDLADVYFKVAGYDVKCAASATASTAKREESLREAKLFYQKSLDIWQQLRARGKLRGADANRANEVARQMALLAEIGG